ncbi:MAG TPA: PaaX family transcriptional regulator C-terminal domain-containing protein [Solirubrobacteraceae bacterium]|nr:PaaX family transcriptional regulator C-terminal domain-containing protein [Solirubrobacteraceae bacterium]
MPRLQYVLRSDPRGVRVIDEQLRRRSVGAPAARSLLLTILGEYVLPRDEAVWQETLVGALVSVGYTQHAARQALARSVRDGWLSTSRHGRRARVSLSDRSADLLRTGAERIYSFGSPWDWDGRWLVLILRVPEARREVRHLLRTRLAWAGLGSMGGGVWLTPHVEREAELREVVLEAPAAEATSFVAELGSMGTPLAVAAAAWDLDSVRSAYADFISDFSAIRPSSDEASFRMQTLLVHAWRKFPFLDPDLPSELLPTGWPRRRAHELFTTRHDHWRPAAFSYFEELEGARPPRAARAA